MLHPFLSPGPEQIAEADPPEELSANPIRYGIHDLATVLRRIDVHAEWACAEGHVDHLDDGVGHRADIRVRRHRSGEALLDVRGEAGIGAGVVFRDPRSVLRGAGVLEVIGSRGERARYDDGCLD